MIRRIIDFVLILIFVWASMIFGLWLIDSVIVPLRLPISGFFGRVLTAILKVLVSAALVIFWLWLWREIVRRTFWRIVRKSSS